MTYDDVIFRHRLRVLSLAEELGSVSAACRMAGIHRSTYYRWKAASERYGLEILRPRERRHPKMPNQIPKFIEQRIVAFALGHPGFGPKRIAAELARKKWGGIKVSSNGVWRVLKRHGISTRTKRLSLIAGYASPPEPEPQPKMKERHLEARRPGELLQMDCFFIGRLSGTEGVVWQYTAIDVYSSYVWARLHVTPKNPSQVFCAELLLEAAEELSKMGWKVGAVMTDNGSEFRGREFRTALLDISASHRQIPAGRPQTNGAVERVQRTILEECWKPAFARYLIPRYTGLCRELKTYLSYYNNDRVHTGRLTKGRTPAEVIGKAKMWK